MEPVLSEAQAFIANCELGERPLPSGALASQPPAGMQTSDEGEHGKGIGAVVEGGLMAFTPDTSEVVRKDVEDSLLFATLVANKAHSIETENRAWFARFNEVLLNLGWPVHDLDYRDHQCGGSDLKMDRLVLEMVALVIGTAALPGPVGPKLLQAATDMISNFSDKQEALKLFERKSISQQGASFRVGTCHEAEDGVVYITLSAVNVSIARQMTSILGFTWRSGDARIQGANRALVFNRRHYERVRATVEDRLGSDTRQAIEAFEI